MLYLSAILIERKDVETFEDFLAVIKEKAASGERFIRFDLKPPFPDTPSNWEDRVESAFSGYIKQ
ncbi:MAG: sulfur relay protein DsrC [Gammaproteobacteria bacterium]|nr:sulfur relay protein DsrC [Gammaproteobacteria bacterium]